MSAVASMIIWIKSTSCLIRSFAISSADQSFYIFTQTSLIKRTILPSQMPDFSWFPFRDSSSSLLSRFSICSSSVLSALGEHRRSLFFPFLSLLQIPVLQMISLYRSSPRFSSCVCAQRTSFCPSHNSKYIKTARIIFWRPNGYEAISALFPFFHYDKTVFCRHYDSVDLCWIVRFLLHYAQLYRYSVCIILCIYHNISPYFAKTSGKHMANRTSTADGSFFTIFTSPPM